ncbi:Phage integrase, N-terminal SAM-like domain [Lentzea fradiae]|uniref:Phage integrase, N-terminal SAM-like domain n=1 Tax=Lentzea fradiae TaxID=200378 RepID=A0A1G7XK45_9PSEU|nr:phage integrase N-terminal SAM-like domain-containing protein [Lentzea fradiae]SDG84441.1 Phage integrase, N-terminal SAM-like domain [Lentzea fradiae]
MPLLDLDKITFGLSKTWAGYLRDWDRTLRSASHPETTRYNYLLAAAQFARYLAEYSPDPDADDAADDPCGVTRAHIEFFQVWMIETGSGATALNKHKGLQAIGVTRSSMDDVPEVVHEVLRGEAERRIVPLLGR